IYQYKWKPNSTKDEPLKEYDDVLDALRYALYSQWLTDNRPTGNQFDVLRQGLKN
ncbi:TPA: PBSX family phage terminase large subunit, partial [Streptococcus agalactiae]